MKGYTHYQYAMAHYSTQIGSLDPPCVIICNFQGKSRGRTNSNGSLNASTRATPPLILKKLQSAVPGCRVVATWLWGCREEADLAPCCLLSCLARPQLRTTVLLSVSMAAS